MRRVLGGVSAAVLAGVVVATLVLSPAEAHVNGRTFHVWRHVRDYADSRYARLGSAYSKAQSNARYEPRDSAYTKAESNAR